MEEKRKTVTSTEVKRRYNQKVYSQISFSAPKELVEEFRGICRNIGISQASVFKKFIADLSDLPLTFKYIIRTCLYCQSLFLTF